MPRKHIRPDNPVDMAKFLLASATPEDDCLTLVPGGKGYVVVQFKGIEHPAHRFVYEHTVAPVPEDYDVHHKCPRKNCINPQHLEPLARVAHNHEHEPWKVHSAKTHCPQGHEYTAANTLLSKSGKRSCRACNLARANARYHAKKVSK